MVKAEGRFWRRAILGGAILASLLLLGDSAFGADGSASDDYRTIFGLSPRLVVWVVAQLHLLFAAFVLGVPIFAVIVEAVGLSQTDVEDSRRYDQLAYLFTKLLSAAFATTAALGGLLTFVLFAGYPSFMGHLVGVFRGVFPVYGLLFIVEGFTLYLYYYSWHRMKGRTSRPALRRLGGGITALAILLLLLRWLGGDAFSFLGPMAAVEPILGGMALVGGGLLAIGYGDKGLHIYLGVLLNLIGLGIMVISNSWVTYMMSPPGLAEGAAGPLATHWQGGEYIGSAGEAFANTLWMPLNIHRFLANIAFGGAICAAYAAIKFIGARTEADRAQYDWMGYVGSFIAIAGLIPLPFAGYYFGREVYSFNPTMGQDMMGGTFSWSFIIQAVFVGTLFLGGNYYLWSGMRRIPGGERYEKFIPFMCAILFACFAVWLTPHNLSLGGVEKRFGLMPAKNAVIQLMILTTYFGFLLYRRSNRGRTRPFSAHGWGGTATILIALVIALAVLGLYARGHQLASDHPEYGKFQAEAILIGPLSIPLGSGVTFAATLRWTLYAQMLLAVVAGGLTFLNRGKLGQGILLGGTAVGASFWLYQHGFLIMEKANPLVRHVAVCQVLMVLSCLILCTAIDIVLFRGAERLGPIRWGKMHRRSQLVLILLCTFFVMNMGLMGYIRSGLRKGWHVVAVIKDTSEWATTPSNFTMAIVVTGITIAFLGLTSFVFWSASLVEPRAPGKEGSDET